jgi:hypothetical protein
MNKNIFKFNVLVLGMTFMSSVFAIENARVLPKGIRNFNIKNARTTVNEKSDASGVFHPIAEPLAKDLTFKKVIDGENGINRMLLRSFLQGKFQDSESLGTFTADMKGNISVTAAILSYGLTDSLTLAIGVPYYQAKMGVNMGFRASDNAEKFINSLNEPANNQAAKSREAAEKLRSSVAELNKKLVTNGYSPVQNFDKSGIGDITIAAKYRFINEKRIRIANANGIVMPTGYVGDPNVPVNIPFGTGSWGIFDTFYIDELITSELWLNQYFKYTYQAPAKKKVRLKTEEETITVDQDRISYKLGNRWETGLSVQYEPWFGLLFATGLSYTGKTGDRYKTKNLASRETLEKDTNDWSSYWETKIGYQSIPAVLRKEFPIPFNVTFEYKKHLRSSNTVVKDLYTFDFNLFF